MTTTTQTRTTGTELTRAQFAVISDLVKDRCGINLHDGKMALVRARLGKRLRALGLTDFGQYVQWISQDVAGTETDAMLDALTTNLTHFFRAPRQFELLGNTIVAGIVDRRRNDRRFRIWSAGCSSGEEPYSIAVTLKEAAVGLVGWDARILATDLSWQMLKIAKTGSTPLSNFGKWLRVWSRSTLHPAVILRATATESMHPCAKWSILRNSTSWLRGR